MTKLVLLMVGLLLTATRTHAGIFTKEKVGRTCIVCKQQMAWTDGHTVEFKEHLDKDGKHRVVIVKTEECVKKISDNPDLYLKKKSIWSFKDNKHGVSIKELFRK